MTEQTNSTGNIKEALDLWEHIFGDEKGLLHIWTGVRNSAGDIDQKSIRFNNYRYPQKRQDAAKWAIEKSAEGREVYFCAHLLTGPRRIKENAAPISALYVDGDGVEVPPHLPQPTATVETSPGRHQYYWRLTMPVPPETAENLSRRMAYAMGADMSGWDLTQLLRVPGTANHKYPSAPGVAL